MEAVRSRRNPADHQIRQIIGKSLKWRRLWWKFREKVAVSWLGFGRDRAKDFAHGDEESCHRRRAAVQHLALFVPWESFLCEETGDINGIWARAREALAPRISCLVDHVQLLRRSAEDAKRDAKQWAASSSDGDPTVAHVEKGGASEAGAGAGAGAGSAATYQSNSIGDATRLIDVVRGAVGTNQVKAKSPELTAMMQQLCRFQQSALRSTAELAATVMTERGERRISMPGRIFSGAALPPQDQVKAIKSQQASASEERERMIQGIQSTPVAWGSDRRAALRRVMTGFGEDEIEITMADSDETASDVNAGMRVLFGPSASFFAAGRGCDAGQLCQFVGDEGGAAAARINGITIHSACGFSKDQGAGANTAKDLDGVRLPKRTERFIHGQSRMSWHEKDVLVIDEVSMLGSRTLHAVNEQLCRLRGSPEDLGGIPIVLFCGDFQQFRPVQERSILLPSAAFSWDVDNSFRAEQRHQHDKAHALWKRFTTVVMLDEQMRAAGDPELQGLLKRIRLGVQDRTDLYLLNSRCYREGRRIPWEAGITVQQSMMRIFISEHKWKEELPTEKEAIMMLNQGDDSAIPVPAIFMFVAGMPVVVNHNTHQGLKLVNGASYSAVEVIVDKAYRDIGSRPT
ncbi:PIF1-like helicase domain-containing protein [Hirsutella rhossiliensis]|uniref:ATP-dependent DNA helicase n=1 Tax=Hirsutella rhossiliensis TaxID=111463 RepID=A0A9P8MNZ0_9HYPO|nr:PIF1-like helicase domain-containing protein [Hirsutella rhossiliensis]KAH0958447.1 PIF1-like helicase domain-containing protein [Hirsutella rhossiliensis]